MFTGATALLAATQNEIGWLYIGIVALSAAIMIVIALLVNNIERRWPVFWWAPTKINVVSKDESDGQTLPFSVTSHESTNRDSSITIPSEEEQHHQIVVSPAEIIVPAHFSQEDHELLKSLQRRLHLQTEKS
jgi:hypothetical protein